MSASEASLIASWTEAQLRQAALASFDDALPFSISAPPAEQLPRVHPLAPNVHREDIEKLVVAGLHTVAGLDISFRDRDGQQGVAVLAILSYPDLKLVASLSRTVDLAATPYVHSFLSFRESHFFVDLLNELRQTRADLPTPQVLFVDGNGRWHPRQAGSAVATGVETGLPTVGIAKEYHPLHPPVSDSLDLSTRKSARPESFPSDFRSSQRAMRTACQALLQRRGDWLGLTPPASFSDETWGAALLSSPARNAQNPIFVSPGHRVSLATAVRLALICTREGKVPEPVRMADKLGREEARRLWPKS